MNAFIQQGCINLRKTESKYTDSFKKKYIFFYKICSFVLQSVQKYCTTLMFLKLIIIIPNQHIRIISERSCDTED